MFDFRSDTVTMPDAPMRQAMATARVGDDVYGEDETVRALETRVAQLLGKDAGLFVPSGTQSNLIAMLTHVPRGGEVISGKRYHVMKYEAGGMAALGGIMPCALPVAQDGSLRPQDILAAIKPDDSHFPQSCLLTLENTHNGLVQSKEGLSALCEIAHKAGMATHLDGARLMNAVVATGDSAAAFAAPFDTVSLCLSKGLGAPAGSVLSGTAPFIDKARRLRKMLGGGMRQAGILAAAGLYALEHNCDRLAEDHKRAKKLAEGLSQIDGVIVDPKTVHTNMVYMAFAEEIKDRLAQALPQALADQDLIISFDKEATRLVVHKDITDGAIDRLVSTIKAQLVA